MELFSTLLWLKETDSTQQRLKEWDAPYGSVIVADRQTEGRGRRGRSWLSQEGGLYFSFLLRPKDFPQLLSLPLLLGLSVAEALEELGFSPAVKWPNDLYLGGRKVCGILCELSGSKLVVGVGLNVNQDSFPPSLPATSLRLEKGREFDRREVLLLLLKFLKEGLEEFREKGFSPFKGEVERRLLYLGEEVRLLGEEEVRGTVAGVSERGGLLLLTEEGLKEFLTGDLSLRPS